MSNTLTNLLPDVYAALDVISRELVGYIPAVSRSSSVAEAAVGATVRVPVAPAATTATTTPGVNAPDAGDQTIDNVELAITKSKHVNVRWNGEETKGLQNAGTFRTIQADRFYQAMRALVNEIEADLHAEAYKNASRAAGTAGTTPFGTANDLSDFANALKILEDNGAPTNDLQLVLGSAAMGNMRGKQSGLFKVNESGREDMLRNGMTDRVMNFAIRNSSSVKLHTKGAGSGYLVNNGGGYAIGDSSVVLDTGTGTVLAGDAVTFAGDSNPYIVNTGVAAPGTIAIGKPGLLAALADNAALTVGNSYTPNVAFSRSAMVLATRAPALPEGGDMATDRTIVVDDLTGLAFEISAYRQYRQVVYQVAIAWGYKAIKSEHIAVLRG